MGKVIKAFFCFILCLVLTASLLASACILGLTHMMNEENVDDLLKGITPSANVFGYERAQSDEKISFGDALREKLPLQNVSLLSIYGDSARSATEAGIQAIEEYVTDESAIVHFTQMAELFTEAYIDDAKETGKLNGTIAYKNIKGERVRVSREAYARELVLERVETDLKMLAKDGTGFGRLTLDGEKTICYTALAGEKAAEAENAIYSSLEALYDGMYKEYLKGLLHYFLTGEDVSQNGSRFVHTEDDIYNLFVTVANGQGIGGSALDDPGVKEEIADQAKDYVLPRLSKMVSIPYSSWISDEAMNDMKLTRIFNKVDPNVLLGIVCGGILLLMIIIGGKMGLGFGSFSALLAGAAMMVIPFFRQRSLDRLGAVLPKEIVDLGIIEPCMDQLLGYLTKYGLYCVAAGRVLLVLRLFAQQKKKKKSDAETAAL